MNTDTSVYPKAIADKCVEMLCFRQPSLQHTAPRLTAACDLMRYGYVQPPEGNNWKGARFVVMAPYTPHFYYAVDLRAEICTCADFLRDQRPCKHLYAVVLTLLARRHLGFIPLIEQMEAEVA